MKKLLTEMKYMRSAMIISNKDTTDSPEGSPIPEGDVNGVIMMKIMWMKEQMLNSGISLI